MQCSWQQELQQFCPGNLGHPLSLRLIRWVSECAHIFVQGYILVLWDCRISLLGLGYLAILAAVLIWPPRRSKFVQLDESGQHLNLQDSCLPSLLQNQSSPDSVTLSLQQCQSAKLPVSPKDFGNLIAAHYYCTLLPKDGVQGTATSLQDLPPLRWYLTQTCIFSPGMVRYTVLQISLPVDLL